MSSPPPRLDRLARQAEQARPARPLAQRELGRPAAQAAAELQEPGEGPAVGAERAADRARNSSAKRLSCVGSAPAKENTAWSGSPTTITRLPRSASARSSLTWSPVVSWNSSTRTHAGAGIAPAWTASRAQSCSRLKHASRFRPIERA